MGGKSYFCDYCQCFMKNDINVRRIHNSGLSHQIAKTNALRPYMDVRQLYAEESAKTPCSRFHQKGFCKFELFCQFTHYTRKQLDQLKKMAKKLEKREHQKEQQQQQLQQEQSAFGSNAFDWRKALPWNSAKETGRKKRGIAKVPKYLPPSLRPIQFHKLNKDCFNTFWG